MQTDSPLLTLLALNRKVRSATNVELPFFVVNETRALADYRQAALYIEKKIKALSGLAQPDLNAPYAQWLKALCKQLELMHATTPAVITSRDVDSELAAQWGDWLPAFVLWLPIPNVGATLFARDTPWDNSTIALMEEWLDSWGHAWCSNQPTQRWSFAHSLNALKNVWYTQPGKRRWQQPRIWIALALLATMLFPVRLSVLAPAELVAANPEVIRAPLDGVIGQFHVEPNQTVAAGQLLFEFDDAAIKAQVLVAEQTLATAEAEYRQNASLAVGDNRPKAQLALLLGKIEEKRAELDYLRDQIERARVIAPTAGVVVFDDTGEWIGRPVQTGERILRIADPSDTEIEIWLPLSDALPFPEQAHVQMYPTATPLHSLSGKLRYAAFEAQARPDDTYAYRLRATLDEKTAKTRLGQKGTARIYAERVPFIYWVIRRPLAIVRQYLGA